jgi:hypothetical protein
LLLRRGVSRPDLLSGGYSEFVGFAVRVPLANDPTLALYGLPFQFGKCVSQFGFVGEQFGEICFQFLKLLVLVLGSLAIVAASNESTTEQS